MLTEIAPIATDKINRPKQPLGQKKAAQHRISTAQQTAIASNTSVEERR